MDVKLGLLSESQFPALMALFKEENYIYPEDYVNYCYQTDPEGFFVATDIQGTIISHCCGVKISEEVGIIGLLITRAGFRGQGSGGKVLRAAMDRLSGMNIVTKVSTNLEPMWLSHGFTTGQLTITGYKATVKKETLEKLYTDDSIKIVPFSDEILPAVLKYDATLQDVVDRSDPVTRWFYRPCMQTIVATKPANDVKGYLCWTTQSDLPLTVLPFYADDGAVARALWKAFLMTAPETKTIAVYPFTDNLDADQLYKETLTVTKELNYLEMHTKSDTLFNTSRVYSVSNFHTTIC